MDIQRYQKNFFELAVGVKSHHIQHALNRRQLQDKPDDHSSEDGHDRFMHSLDLPGLQNIAGEEAMISRPIKIDSAQEVYISFCPASELVSGSGSSPCCAVSRSASVGRRTGYRDRIGPFRRGVVQGGRARVECDVQREVALLRVEGG